MVDLLGVESYDGRIHFINVHHIKEIEVDKNKDSVMIYFAPNYGLYFKGEDAKTILRYAESRRMNIDLVHDELKSLVGKNVV